MLPYIVLVFIASIYEYAGTILLQINVKYWFVLYEFLVCLALFYYYYKLLNKVNKRLFYFFIILFLFISLNNIIVWDGENFNVLASYYNLLQTIFIITFSVQWIKGMFTSLKVESFTESSVFYFVSGLILYYSGTVFLFLMSNLIFKMDKSSFQEYWMLNIILNLALRTLLLIGIWKGRVK